MTADNWIARAGVIISFLSLVVVIIGGVLAIMCYLRIIKSTDENAKELKEMIDQAAAEATHAIDEMGSKVADHTKKQSYKFMAVILFMWGVVFLAIHSQYRQIEKLKEERNK